MNLQTFVSVVRFQSNGCALLMMNGITMIWSESKFQPFNFISTRPTEIIKKKPKTKTNESY